MKVVIAFASGGGGNFRALCEAFKDSDINIKGLVVDRDCGAEKVAKQYEIPVTKMDFSENVVDQLQGLPKCDLIALCGFNRIIPPEFLDETDVPVLNTHPSLLPAYGGKGMIGVKVQEAVKENGEKYAGCTIHLVDGGVDTGPHVLQCRILVDKDETPWELGGRIHALENKLFPLAIEMVLNGGSRARPT